MDDRLCVVVALAGALTIHGVCLHLGLNPLAPPQRLGVDTVRPHSSISSACASTVGESPLSCR
jgi:hypothetical protein